MMTRKSEIGISCAKTDMLPFCKVEAMAADVRERDISENIFGRVLQYYVILDSSCTIAS